MMFYRGLMIFLNLVPIFYCASSETLAKKNDKRLEIGNSFETCLDSFDVHRDKIIKTQDSQEMGAKYLTEMDIGSRQECLKFCCQVDRCDVFVFEEKKPGSCYLFQCGPLDDFKCKFTSHSNYTSAVRTNYNTQSAVLEEQIRISQQEHELKSLRKLSDVPPSEYSFTQPPSKLIVTLIPKSTVTTPVVPKTVCSHNQYECRSTGDCIAIYNVCDGIPQCADGSDEAADLVCPTEKSTVPPSLVLQGPPPPLLPPDIIKYQQTIDQRKPFPPVYVSGPENNPKPWELPNLTHQVISQQQNLLYPVQPIGISQLHKNVVAPGYQWDYQPIYEQNKDPYNTANSFREHNNVNPYEQDQPHIFHHKWPGVVEDNGADSSNYLDGKRPYVSHLSTSNRGTWQEGQALPVPATSAPLIFQQKPINEVQKYPKSTVAAPCDTSVQHKEDLTKNKNLNKTNETVGKNMLTDKPTTNKGIEKLSRPQNDNTKRNRLTQVNQLKDHSSVIVIEDHAREHENGNLIAERLQQITTNESLKPKGAVISLALGLVATAVTATLIACRLRVVRKRGRRGHGPYAHDADYLVNGMYL